MAALEEVGYMQLAVALDEAKQELLLFFVFRE